MATARLWPNGLGWDVGRAEVRNIVKALRAFVPMREIKFQRATHKCMDFPLGTDPVECVEECRKHGVVYLDY